MKGISLHPRTHSAPSNSSTPSSRAASAINGEAAPQPKGVRKLVKKLQGGIRHISHIGHHPKAAAISAVPVRDQSVVASIPPSHTPVDSIVGIVHDIPALPIAFPLYPKSKTSFDSMSASTLTSEGEPADVTDAHSFDAHSVDRPSSFASAADHLSIRDSSSVHSASVDASSACVSAVGDSSTPALLDSVAALSPQPAPGDNMSSPQPNLPEAELDQPVAPEDDEPTAAPETAAPEASQPAESDSPEPSESPDPVVPMPPEEERASTLDDSKFDASESEDKEEGTMEVDSSPRSEEPEVPDPFLVDEPEDSPSEEPEAAEEVAEEPTGLQVDIRPSLAAADEVSLVQPSDASEELPPALPADVNKDVPPPPPQLVSDEEEEEAPELYLPGLTLPTMFLPIPNTDPLSTLLTKYIPPEKRPSRDLSGNWQGADFNTLVMTNSWRALASMARDRIVDADPEDLDLILSLWYLRLSCLARLRLFNQTSAECTNLFTVLNGVEPATAREWLFDRKLPFELEVLHARLKYWAGDHMGYLDALSALLKQCKIKARVAGAKKDATGFVMWQERGARVCLIIASQLIEMKDVMAAAKLLEPLCRQGDTTSPYMQSAIGRVYLQGGYVTMAMKHFMDVAQDPAADQTLKLMNSALLASANGDWPKAIEELRRLLAADPENFVALNNLSVALLSEGRIQQGIQVLEEAIKISPATTLATEPLLFNLSTMYELRSTAGADKKRDLLVEVAKWAGDGLRTTCLKMPSN